MTPTPQNTSTPELNNKPLPCMTEITLLHGAKARERKRGARFSSLPNRVDCGIDQQWGSPTHRTAIRLVRLMPKSKAKAEPIYEHSQVNGAFRGLVFGVLLEALLIAGGIVYVVVQKVY